MDQLDIETNTAALAFLLPPELQQLNKQTRKISIRTKANRPLRDRNRNTLPFDSRMTLTSK